MLGLMIKDIYTMWKETRIFMLWIVVVVLFIRNDFLYSYAVFYAVMLPVSAFGYDERAKWNELAGMFPYTSGQIVGSKYMIGCLSIAAAGLLGILGRFFNSSGGFISLEQWAAVLFMICGALMVQAIYLPFVFWIGVEKGRLMIMFLVIVFVLAAINMIDMIDINLNLNIMLAAALAAAAAGNLLSFWISKRIYQCKL